MVSDAIHGVGLGLRRGMLEPLAELQPGDVDFLEVAPENWMDVGGRFGRQFRALAERFPLVCHGLSLSIGSPAPLDVAFVKRLKTFLDAHGVAVYSEHLSYCSDDRGHLYDLLPMPFTSAAADYVAARLRQVQDILERPVVIENISYYAAPGQAMEEAAFINHVLEAADCGLLLDVNNVFVNSHNHGYDALEFLSALDLQRTAYVHVAGHYVEPDGIRVDTHGSAVIEPVWALLAHAMQAIGPRPVLVERDFNFPPLAELLAEVQRARQVQSHAVVGSSRRDTDHVASR